MNPSTHHSMMKVVLSLVISTSHKSFSALPLVHSLRPVSSIARPSNCRTLTDRGCATPFSSYSDVFHGTTSVRDYAPSNSWIGHTNIAQVTTTSRAGRLGPIIDSRTSLSSGSSTDDMPSPKPIEFVWVQLYIDEMPVGIPFCLDFTKRERQDIPSVASMIKKECSKLLEDVDAPLLQFYAHDDNEFETQLGPEVTLAAEVNGGDSLERVIIVNAPMPKGMSN
jgi:hypothetical protein